MILTLYLFLDTELTKIIVTKGNRACSAPINFFYLNDFQPYFIAEPFYKKKTLYRSLIWKAYLNNMHLFLKFLLTILI